MSKTKLIWATPTLRLRCGFDFVSRRRPPALGAIQVLRNTRGEGGGGGGGGRGVTPALRSVTGGWGGVGISVT